MPKVPKSKLLVILSLTNTYSLTEIDLHCCKSAKNARGDNEETIRYGNEKKVIFEVGQGLPLSSQKGVLLCSRRSVDAIIVTTLHYSE